MHLVMDVALGTSTDSILESHDLQYHQFEAICKSPQFALQVADLRKQLEKEGATFRLKAQLQADFYLTQVHEMVMDKEMDPKVRVRLIEDVARWGGLDAPEQTGTGSIVREALDAKQNISAVITKAATAQTSLLTDAGQYQRFTNAGASTYTIAPQSSVAWADNTELTIRRAAAANLTLVAGSGVTLNAPSGGTLVLTNNMTVTLKRVAANVWDVIGQTVAA